MKRLIHIAAGSALLAFSAAAQDIAMQQAKLKAEAEMMQFRMVGAVKGATIKGAPYSADEITESNQILTLNNLRHRVTLRTDGGIRTGRDVGTSPGALEGWPLARHPLPLETSLPGLFACGDVRSGSIKRCAAAIGEGSMSVALVHQRLAEVGGE